MNLTEATQVAQQFLDRAGLAQRALPYGIETADSFILRRTLVSDDDTVLVVDKATGVATLEVYPLGEDDPWAGAAPVGHDPERLRHTET